MLEPPVARRPVPRARVAVAAVVALAALAGAAAACVPHRDLPPDQIVKLGKLSDVMDVQATVADPQFKKIDQDDAYTDADWSAFADCGARLQVTSQKAKDFSKGPGFDALAQQLHDQAASLQAAAEKKDTQGAKTALASMKATCKSCHSQFR